MEAQSSQDSDDPEQLPELPTSEEQYAFITHSEDLSEQSLGVSALIFMACKRGPGRSANKRFGPKVFNNTNKAPNTNETKRKQNDAGDPIEPTQKRH